MKGKLKSIIVNKTKLNSDRCDLKTTYLSLKIYPLSLWDRKMYIFYTKIIVLFYFKLTTKSFLLLLWRWRILFPFVDGYVSIFVNVCEDFIIIYLEKILPFNNLRLYSCIVISNLQPIIVQCQKVLCGSDN